MPSTNDSLSQETGVALSERLPPGVRVAVLGSTSFWSSQSRAVCEALGEQLAARSDVVLLTGGMTGVAEVVSRMFVLTRNRLRLPSNIFHVVPVGSMSACIGPVIEAGRDLQERREVLGRLATIYVVVEGGPGTEHEVHIAQSRDALVIPVGRTGGAAARLQERCVDKRLTTGAGWPRLNSRDATAVELAQAVMAFLPGTT